ncbi:MAG: ATP synthase F0 subunit B [Chitinophagia bacterium]|nr:ATP synthase F0 subunit B [Chitinophagia bacterium]
MDLLTPELGLFLWTLIAFLLVLFILGKFAWKPILQSLGEREKSIADAISSAEKVKGEMGQMKAENEKLMAEAREERAIMLKEAKEMKDKMLNEAREQAKTEANKIISEAYMQIQQQKNAAITEVKNEIGSMAIQVAEKILKQQLNTPEGQSAYIQSLSTDYKLN